MIKERTLKVYAIFIRIPFKGSRLDPEIRLKGKWLKEYGFECGDEVSVSPSFGELKVRLKKAPPLIHL